MRDKELSIVIGAGVAGLTLAYRIAAEGGRVLVLERDGNVGGLGGSFRYEDFTFDMGPHRFHTDEPAVSAFIKEILQDDFLLIQRSSAVYMAGRFIPWPLSPASIRLLDPKLLLGSFLDFCRPKNKDGDTFDAYIIRRYGETLYRRFFEPYTRKFLGIPCNEISRDWAITGIDRAVIDQTSAAEDLFALASSLFRTRKPLEFIYPRCGGIDIFAEKLARKLQEKGGTLLLGSQVTGLTVEAGKVTAVTTASGSHCCGRVFWSGSLHDLAGCLDVAAPRLEYLSMLLFNYRIAAPCRIPFQWCYFGEEHVPFNRVSFPANFNPRLAPEGSCGLCVEVTVRERDHLWQKPMRLESDIRKALVKVGLVRPSDAIVGVSAEKIREAYPIYRVGYRQEADSFFRKLPRNVIPFGRTGGFWYNNMDNSISEALRIADGLKAEEKALHG